MFLILDIAHNYRKSKDNLTRAIFPSVSLCLFHMLKDSLICHDVKLLSPDQALT